MYNRILEQVSRKTMECEASLGSRDRVIETLTGAIKHSKHNRTMASLASCQGRVQLLGEFNADAAPAFIPFSYLARLTQFIV